MVSVVVRRHRVRRPGGARASIQPAVRAVAYPLVEYGLGVGALSAGWVIANDGAVADSTVVGDGRLNHAFTVENGVVVDLGQLDEFSVALDLNERGQVVGCVRPAEPAATPRAGRLHATLWEADGTLVDLNQFIAEWPSPPPSRPSNPCDPAARREDQSRGDGGNRMILEITPTSGIDWDSPGARFYHVPFTLDGTWGRVRVPLYVACASQPGKTVVAIGGTHGDEYEGPVGLKNLIRELNPGRLVAGRLIVIPVLNVPAFRAGRRESPLDGGNMNRVFPGDAGGTITSRIARFVTDEVLKRADIVLDLHSGGAGFEIFRTMSFHRVDDPVRFAAFRETALLFGTPFVMIYTSGMGSGLLTEEAEAMGKITIGSELGFGASTDLAGVRWAHHGTLNVLRRHGLLAEPVVDLTPPGLDRQRVVAATEIDRWVTAPVSGISEPLVPLGAFVRAGTPVTRIHDFERIEEPPVEIVADGDGYVLCRKFRAPTEQGEVVMVIAEEIG